MMPAAISRLERRAVTRLQDILALIGHEHHLTGDDIDELILLRMPVALTGPRAWG